jgi:hypothetical protein
MDAAAVVADVGVLAVRRLAQESSVDDGFWLLPMLAFVVRDAFVALDFGGEFNKNPLPKTNLLPPFLFDFGLSSASVDSLLVPLSRCDDSTPSSACMPDAMFLFFGDSRSRPRQDSERKSYRAVSKTAA